jgi:Mannosyltransferase putative
MTNIEGIYILANDVVYDQLVALLNSIKVNAGADYPVCIIPYDDNLNQVKEEVLKRENVTIFENKNIAETWDNFVFNVWRHYPLKATQIWQNKGYKIDEQYLHKYRQGTYHRYYGFDGIFDKFIYLDADTLVLNSLEMFFQQLNKHDFIVYDFQHKDLAHVYNIYSEKLTAVFSQDSLDKKIFCSGLFATKKNILNEDKRNWLISQIQQEEGEILYLPSVDQSLLNYMVMKTGISIYNFALNLPSEQVTGCSVTSPHFIEKDHLVYDQGKRLTYLHYIGLSSQLFTRICQGENIDFPYRETFLHYRYLHEPEKSPKFTGKPKPYNPPPSLLNRVLRKLGINKN